MDYLVRFMFLRYLKVVNVDILVATVLKDVCLFLLACSLATFGIDGVRRVGSVVARCVVENTTATRAASIGRGVRDRRGDSARA